MCGIAGIIGNNCDEEVSGLIGKLQHRGPDDQGYWNNDRALLASTRLMITSDYEEGVQPFVKGGHVLVFNGEIFNYRSLGTHSTDTEVLMDGLIKEGESFLRKLDGQFALAFYDVRQNQILLARDHMGRMPLFYTLSEDGRFIFGSEMKAIFSVGVKAELKEGDPNFRYQWSNHIPTTNDTIFKNIYQVLPGECLIVNGGIEKKRYYRLTQPLILQKPESYFLDQLPSLLERSVTRELTGNAKIGLSFSGGVDSTIVLKVLSEQLDYPVVSIAAFRDEEYFDVVREASELFNTELVEIKLDKSIVKDLPRVLYAIETYGMGHGIELLHYTISKKAKEYGVKVLMCGAGIDEEFLGYEHFSDSPSVDERFNEISQLFNSHLYVRDRTRMAHGIEARCPFVNRELIEFALRVPTSYCVDGSGAKKIMRKAAATFLPERFANIPKIQSYTHSNIFSLIQEELGIQTNEEYMEICRDLVKKMFVDGKDVDSVKL